MPLTIALFPYSFIGSDFKTRSLNAIDSEISFEKIRDNIEKEEMAIEVIGL